MATVTPQPAGLAVTHRPHRRTRLAAYAGAVVVLVAAVAWVTTHPGALPTSTRTVQATTPVQETVFVGVFEAPDDRTLHVSGVRVFADSTTEATIVPHVCKGGSVSATTTIDSFCQEVVGTEGTELEPGDEIVLEVTGASAGTIDVDRVRIAYRDGVQWAVQDAGSPARVEVLER